VKLVHLLTTEILLVLTGVALAVEAGRRRALMIILLLLMQPLTAYAELLVNLTIEHQGTTRFYNLMVPPNVGEQPAALVLDLHGRTLTKDDQRDESGFEGLAEREGFFVAWPDGLGQKWQAELSPATRDIEFLRALVAHLVNEYNIDPNRIYATGHSMGGGMVYRLACEASDLFAAYSIMAATMISTDVPKCNPSRPIPILSIHGLDDDIAPYYGGLIDGAGDVVFLSAVDTLEFWRGKNSCNGPLERENFGPEAWCDADHNCEDDAQTAMCTVYGGYGSGPYNHLIYHNTAGLDLAELSWNFFQSFSLASFQINAGLNDAWYYEPTSGQGFFITVFPDLGAVSLAWFTYDTELPPLDALANLGDPGHRWLTAVGPIDGNQAVMEIEMTSGGIFDTASIIERTDPPGSDGTIILTFDSCNSGTIEYDIPSIDRQGIIPIVRVANDNIVICEALSTD
jgi:polyhydroxybutyrate depolymerase